MDAAGAAAAAPPALMIKSTPAPRVESLISNRFQRFYNASDDDYLCYKEIFSIRLKEENDVFLKYFNIVYMVI